MRMLVLALLIILSLVPTSPSRVCGQQRSGKELTKLREEFIKATLEYKTSLQQLLDSYQRSVQRAEQRLAQARELKKQGLADEALVQSSLRALTEANDKVKATQDRIAAADRQIADVLREASAPAGSSARRIPDELSEMEEKATEVIALSEDHFRKGKLLLEDKKADKAREEFDKAIDVILESGFDVRASQNLQAFYLEMIERIYRQEVPLGRTGISNAVPAIGFREQEFEPSPLDELSKLVLTPDEQVADLRGLDRVQTCDPGIIRAAQLRGFRLGMTLAEVKARLPQLKTPSFDRSGYGETSVRFTKTSPTPAFLKGVQMMVFNFIDGRVSYVAAVYDNSITWRSLDQFTSQVSNSLALPAVWRSYSYAGVPQRILECGKLRFVASMLTGAGRSAPALFLVDNAGIDKVIARRVALREAERKAEELRLQKKVQEEEQRRKAFKP